MAAVTVPRDLGAQERSVVPFKARNLQGSVPWHEVPTSRIHRESGTGVRNADAQAQPRPLNQRLWRWSPRLCLEKSPDAAQASPITCAEPGSRTQRVDVLPATSDVTDHFR